MENTKRFWLISLVVLSLSAFGCKEYPKELDPPDIDIAQDSEDPTPTPTPTPEPSNPVCTEIMSAADGANGFLWKPESDSSGDMVVLLPSRFIVQFDSVVVERADGSVESLRFTGFSNGDRQTWRGRSPGSFYRDKGIISAEEFKQNCNWQLPGKASRRHD